jgi:hypothetical protein
MTAPSWNSLTQTLAASAALALALVAMLLRRERRCDCLPRCARCGYIVRGVPSARCPECGSRLYPRGVRFPGFFRRPGPRPRVELWSLLVIAAWVAVVASWMAASGWTGAVDHADALNLLLASFVLAVLWLAGVCLLLLRFGRRGHERHK